MYDERRSTGLHMGWFLAESGFLVIFTGELLLRFCADGLKRICFSPWVLFDMLLVSAGIADTWIMTLIIQRDGVNSDRQDLQFVTLLRIVRLLRLARILRILRIFRFFKELLLLAQGIMGAIKALFWAMMLIVLILYVCAIFATKLLGKRDLDDSGSTDEDLQIWFGTLPRSLLTFFQIITVEGWPEIARHCMATVDPWLGLWFVLFLMLTNTVLLNLVTGVILENVLAISRHEAEQLMKKEDEERRQTMVAIKKAFEIADKNGDGTLTRQEFKDAMHSSEMLDQLKACFIGQYEAEELFELLDLDHNGAIEVDEFMEGCLRVKGNARAKHLLGVQYDLGKVGSILGKQIDSLDQKMQAICQHLGMDNPLATLDAEVPFGDRSSSRISRQSRSKDLFKSGSNLVQSPSDSKSLSKSSLSRSFLSGSQEPWQAPAGIRHQGLDTLVSGFLDKKLEPTFQKLYHLQEEVHELLELADLFTEGDSGQQGVELHEQQCLNDDRQQPEDSLVVSPQGKVDELDRFQIRL
eukprot:gnl/MRDRNA2_/MRDRNA2_76617_c0_seq3.p1 gnl/MRDRNA2_/MRDRNA2_76617_c0~~gnl/MRDRNA2_/MRDRNA2_76617_c0_seq3.p1  ORF type:complete len:563 (+),score=100.78 gnl/MRDRNA2_/MRDRNA2_76617_c0_seq3:120-1691(+)